MPIVKRNQDLTLLLIIVAGLLLLASCETGEPGCYEPKVAAGVAGFLWRDTSIVEDTVTLDPLVVKLDTTYRFGDSIMGTPELKLLNENIAFSVLGQKTAALGIAFNQDKDSVQYTFRTDTTSNVYDTITIHYTSSLHFISNNCGYNYNFGIQGITHTSNMIDSVALLDAEVTNVAKRNVQFYFKRDF